jgi:hypothetical protein
MALKKRAGATGGSIVKDTLQRLRDAVTTRGREVEVDPDGTVREVEAGSTEKKTDEPKATKLSERTFGVR